MRTIYLVSVAPFAGKNVLCLGLARRLVEQGMTVGYMKPYGPLAMAYDDGETDSDAFLFKEVLHLEEPLKDLCPVVLSSEIIADVLRGVEIGARETIAQAFERNAEGKDVMLVVGTGCLSAGTWLGCPTLELIKLMEAKVLMLDRYSDRHESIDGILHTHETLGDDLAGVVFNRVVNSAFSEIENGVKPFLEERGIEVFGVMSRDRLLGSVTVREIANALNGRVLCGGSELEGLVEGFIIGAMGVDAAVRYFRRSPHRAVITGGDRADVQLAAIVAGAQCLILTGNLYPSERILTRAEDAGVPVILVAEDTAGAMAVCENLAALGSLKSERKIRRAQEICDERLDWDRLLEAVGMP